RELRRCAPHGSLPPCGGGTGRGVATAHRARSCFSAQILKIRSLEAAFVRYRIENNRCTCCTPLPVPPPHGGRERRGTDLHTSHAAFAFASQHVCMPWRASWDPGRQIEESEPMALGSRLRGNE